MRISRIIRKRIVIDIFFFATALIILIFSLIPIKYKIFTEFDFFDKLLHTVAYLIFGSLALLFFYHRNYSSITRLLIAIILCTSYGFIIELIQPFTGRNFELADICVNFLGATIGTLLAAFYVRRI